MLFTRKSKIVVIGALSAALLGGGVAVAAQRTSHASSAQKGGKIGIFIKASNGPVSKILIAGAIGDYGKAISIDKNGKVDNNGNYVNIKLKKGTFEVNATKLDKVLNNTPPSLDKATCSVYLVKTHTVTLYNGTGAYAGISGTPKITISYAFLVPRVKSGKHKGECDFRNKTKPLSQFQSIQGGGTVSFS